MHTIIINGNVGRDAELRALQDGTPILSFSLASKDGKDKTTWFDCAIWRDRATALAPYITKGTGLAITGTVKSDAWVKDGDARSKITVNVDKLDFTGGKSESGDAAPRREPNMEPVGDLDDSLPF